MNCCCCQSDHSDLRLVRWARPAQVAAVQPILPLLLLNYCASVNPGIATVAQILLKDSSENYSEAMDEL